MKQKSFFQEPTAAQIMNRKYINYVYSDFIQDILDSGDNDAIVIKADLIPKKYKSSRKFMKHGPEVMLHQCKDLEDSVNNATWGKKEPYKLRKIAFDKTKDRKAESVFCGYSAIPIIGKDLRKRRYSLVECVEGSKDYCYSEQVPGVKIKVEPYDKAERVAIEGAKIIVEVPSRTKKHRRYIFRFNSVPVVDNVYKYILPNSINTDHACDSKRFNIRYTYREDKETSDLFNFCRHEIAAYFAIADYYKNIENNPVPMEMCPFAIPSLLTVIFNKKLSKNCLIQGSKDKKPRKPRIAERERINWELVKKFDYDDTFFAKSKIKDYEWH